MCIVVCPFKVMTMSIARRQVILLVVVVTGILQLSEQAQDCKKIMKERYFNRCSRQKRSSPFILEPTNPSEMETRQDHRHHRSRRQIMSIREIFVASRVPIYHVPYPSFARHEYAPAVPPSDADIYRVQPSKAESLPQESHSEVGFEMSYEEMIELFNEIYERMPRGIKSRETLREIRECCKNEERCRTKKDLFPCEHDY